MVHYNVKFIYIVLRPGGVTGRQLHNYVKASLCVCVYVCVCVCVCVCVVCACVYSYRQEYFMKI